MGHIGKKGTLCLVGILRSMDRLIECLIHLFIRGTVRHNQDVFLFPVYLTAHCNIMKPSLFPCFLMNTFKIPFLLFINLNLLQIIFLRIFRFLRMHSPQNTNIFADLFYCNAQQLFHIRTDVICLICFRIQHQENIIHIHGKLLKQLFPVQDLRIFFLEAYPAFP